jgi:ACS family pantothenate transporter-like MFS transporter
LLIDTHLRLVFNAEGTSFAWYIYLCLYFPHLAVIDWGRQFSYFPLNMATKETLSESSTPSPSSTVPSRSWRGWLWDSADSSKEERKFLFKLDATLLTFGTLGMLIKWIDTSNITNAFVSGMKEDLHLYGNEYNYIVVSWTVGYIVGQWPSNIILTRVPAHIWIPFQEIGWTVFTFALAGAKSYEALLGLRFVVGLFEAGYWPALYYVLGSWYNKRKMLCDQALPSYIC